MKTSQIFYSAVVVLGLIALGNASEAGKAARPIEAKTEAAKLDDKADMSDAKTKRRRSKVALKRVQAGCVPISTSVGDQALSEETPLDDSFGALAPGTTVCNALGATAEIEIDEAGEVRPIRVANASPSDLARYRESFDLIVRNINQGNGVKGAAPVPTPAATPDPPAPIAPIAPVAPIAPIEPIAPPSIPPIPLAPGTQPTQSET
jgi:hypothetical protein